MKIIKTFAIAALFAASSLNALAGEKITVFAAASMKDALEQAASDFKAETGTQVTLSLAASSALAKQLEQGAPANLFISADEKWMDYVQEKSLIDPASRAIVARNDLVIAVPADSTVNGDIAAVLGKDKFAMGDPAGVPAGKYAQSALEKLGLWEGIKGNAVYADNVRSALAFVTKKELNAGIVYTSDAFVDKGVKVAVTFPADSHPAIVYPAAVTKDGGADAKAFLDWLAGEKGQAILVAKGFKPAKAQ